MQKKPKGHYMGMGIAIGLPLGIPIGLALGNIAFGPAIGAAIGVALGAALEHNNKGNVRPLTKKEKALKKKVLLSSLAIGFVIFAALMLRYIS